MTQGRRFDSGLLGDVQRTPQGGIRAPATLTRVGVFPYKLADGSRRRELRLPEEVFAPESLATLEAAPLTDLHPPDGVTADNWRQLTIGHVVSQAQPSGPYVSADVVIQDAEAIRRVDAGERKELSCGYDCALEMVSGEYQGEPYDAIQRRIRYNHVALGPPGWGRAGANVALRLDSADGVLDEEGSETMIKIDGKDFAEADVRALLGERDTYKGKAEAEAKRADAAAAELKAATDPKRLHAVATKRAKLLAAADQILGQRADGGASVLKGKRLDEVSDSMSDLDLMKAMLAAVDPSFDPDNQSEDYIRGVFAANVKALAKGKTAPESGAAPEATDGPSDYPKPEGNGAPPPPSGGSDEDRALDSFNSLRKPPSVAKQSKQDAADDNSAEGARQRMLKHQAEIGMQPLAARK